MRFNANVYQNENSTILVNIYSSWLLSGRVATAICGITHRTNTQTTQICSTLSDKFCVKKTMVWREMKIKTMTK